MPHPYGFDIAARPWSSALQRACQVAREHAAGIDREGRFPAEAVAALKEGNLLGLCVPSALGGLGEGPRAFCAVVEALSGACGSTAMIYVMHVTAAAAIGSSAVLAGKDDLLREIARGEHLTTLALSEVGSRSLFWLPISKMTPKGQGYEVTVRKSWVTAAGQAKSYVSTSQRPGAESAEERTFYLVRRNPSTVRVAGAFDGLGLRGNDSAPVDMTAYQVPEGDLLTVQGGGAEMEEGVVLAWFVLGSTAMANGVCRAAVDETARHLSTARFENTGQTLRDLPNLRARLGMMAVRTEQARSLLGSTLSAMEAGADTAMLYVLQTRLASLHAAIEVTELAMKTCGGAAYSRHLPIERHFRDARAGWVMTPTGDHLEDAIGRVLTGLPPF